MSATHNFSAMVLPEFDMEMANTRKILAAVPDHLLDWQAHPTSRTIGWNANHLAEIPGWVAGTLSATVWDFAPVGGEPYKSPELRSSREILELFDKNVAAARNALEAASDEQLNVIWSLAAGGNVLMSMPRSAVVRIWVLNHTIHHRAHLIVYLRLNGIALPEMYNPA